MEKQVLSIEQMQELIKLGIDTSKASMVWLPVMAIDKATNTSYVDRHDLSIKYSICDAYWKTQEGKETYPTFTLQDILLLTENTQPSLWSKDGMPLWCIQNYMANCYFSDKNTMTVMFKYIKWCKVNNYI